MHETLFECFDALVDAQEGFRYYFVLILGVFKRIDDLNELSNAVLVKVRERLSLNQSQRVLHLFIGLLEVSESTEASSPLE